MATTDFEAIRARQIETVRLITPTKLPLHRFRTWDVDHDDFSAWADSSGEAFRVFDVEHNLDYSSVVFLDIEADDVVHTESLRIAYPRHATFGGHRLTALMDQDTVDILKAIEQRGYTSYVDGQHNCQLAGTLVEEMPAARVLRLTFHLQYHRSV